MGPSLLNIQYKVQQVADRETENMISKKTAFSSVVFMALLLVAYGTALSKTTGITKLMEACESGDVPKVRSLLEKGTDVNKLDSDGSSALLYAIDSIMPTQIRA